MQNMANLNKANEQRQTIMFNLSQLKIAGENTMLLLKITDNTLTLLKASLINSELFDLESFKKVIFEGERHFPQLQFPIRNITRQVLQDIQSLIEIKSVGLNNFLMIIPLVEKYSYNIFQFIPLPVTLPPKELMIADMDKDIMLYNGETYYLTREDKLTKVQNEYLLIEDIPRWDKTETSCQLEALNKNYNKLIKICRFKKLTNSHDLYLTDSKNHRIMFANTERVITLDCPSGKIRQKIVGLHIVPNKCSIKTDGVNWPAKADKFIELKELLDEANKGGIFDITSLPIYEINSTNPMHDTIIEQIDKLPTNHSLTFTFRDFDLTTEEVQVYSTFAYMVLLILVIINSVIIGILYFRHLRGKNGNDNDDSSEDSPNHRFGRKLFARDSLNDLRTSFRGIKDRISNIRSNLSEMSSRRSSVRSSIKSAQGRVRKSSRSLKRKIVNAPYIRNRSKSPLNRRDTVEVGTNTLVMYPSLSSIDSSPQVNKQNREPILKAYR